MAAAAVPILALVLIVVPAKGMLLVALLAAGIGGAEAALMAMPRAPAWRRAMVPVITLLGFSSIYALTLNPVVGLGLLALLVIACVTLGLGSRRGFETALRESSLMLLVALWVGGLLAFLPLATARPHGGLWGILLLGCAFLGDTAAYAVGRAWGRTLLAPAVSPKKTWEGAIAGLVAVMGWIAVAKVTFLPQLTFVDPLLLGAPAAVLSQTGDLAESMLKRAFNAKDASGLFPGHGGMLDRLDSILFLAPLIYLFTFLR